MFDTVGLAQVARKVMDHMAGQPLEAPVGKGHGGLLSHRDRGRALSVLRAIHPELSLRQAEALLRESSQDLSGVAEGGTK